MPENTEPGAAEGNDTFSDFHVTTLCRIPATQTALQDRKCFIHARAVTKKKKGAGTQGCSG